MGLIEFTTVNQFKTVSQSDINPLITHPTRDGLTTLPESASSTRFEQQLTFESLRLT